MNDAMKTNIVPKKILRKIQKNTLGILRDAVMCSAGPVGSTTQILGIRDPQSGKQLRHTEYTKDGHDILSAIQLNMPIENSIQKEMTELTRYITKEVGDGTTSAVVLSSFIFDALLEMEKTNESFKNRPYKIVQTFKKASALMKEEILKHRKELTLEDVKKIAMICTNNNETVSSTIEDIYRQHGLDVFVDVSTSMNENSYIKSYDGLTLESGYADSAYINTVDNSAKSGDESTSGKSIIRNPRIYAFNDPIDTIEMANFLKTIIFTNIMHPYQAWVQTRNEDGPKYIPTVILAPKISIDSSSIMTDIAGFMYSAPLEQKPPLLIVTNLNPVQQDIYSDIWRLCGCKLIKKYIDPDIQARDVADGTAPTLETITEFYGSCDEIISDVAKTTFINPKDFYEKDENGNFIKDESGNRVFSKVYTSQIEFLEKELEIVKESGDADQIGNLKRRIHSLKANMVDFLVGGVTLTDRESVRALVEDAVKNIRSSAMYGFGYGANFEGLRASTDILSRYSLNPTIDEDEKDVIDLISVINQAYIAISTSLYNTCTDEENAKKLVMKSVLDYNCPYNIVTGEFDGRVLCTIMEDITIIDVISKIISVMFTSNQALLSSPLENMYSIYEDEE